jgi:hypothetical protein
MTLPTARHYHTIFTTLEPMRVGFTTDRETQQTVAQEFIKAVQSRSRLFIRAPRAVKVRMPLDWTC